MAKHPETTHATFTPVFRLCIHLVCVSMILVCTSIATHAQNIAVKGKVSNTQGKPISYANIINAQTKILLATSNAEGDFQFLTKEVCTIIVSSVGYQSMRLVIVQDSSIAITLEEAPYSLNEVVVSAVNARQLYDSCVARLFNRDIDTTILQKAFYRMTSIYNHKKIYELVEANYLSQTHKLGVATNELQNGRYGYIDSMYEKGAVYSLDFSRLVTELQLNNAENISQTKYPIFPFFRFNVRKQISIQDLGSFVSENIAYQKLKITPHKRISGGVFQAEITINKETYALKKAVFNIYGSNKNIIQSINKYMQIFTDTIEIVLELNDDFANTSFIQNMSMTMVYRTLRPESRFSTSTTHTKTKVDYVGYEFVTLLNTQPHVDFLDDRDVIQQTLYLSKIWQNQSVLKPITSEQFTIDYFNEQNLFKNKFDTHSDTISYLGNKWAMCKKGRIFESDTTKPMYPRNELVLRLTFDKENYDTVGEYYLDIHAYTAFDDCSLNYVVIPIYDLEYSWRNPEMIDADLDKQLQFALNKLTLDYTDLISQSLGSITAPCMNKAKVESVKTDLLKLYYEKRDALIAAKWKEVLENKIYFTCPKKPK